MRLQSNMPNYEIRRVFFHEVGHFVAREINWKNYGGAEPISIVIQPYYQRRDLFVGALKVDIAGKALPILKNLSEILASIVYGCIFQAYYLSQPLKPCFDANGEDDYGLWYGALAKNGYDLDKKELYEIDCEYSDRLQKEKLLANFMSITPEDYLEDNGDEIYTVNLQKLREDIAPFIDSHHEIYKSLLEKYNAVFF